MIVRDLEVEFAPAKLMSLSTSLSEAASQGTLKTEHVPAPGLSGGPRAQRVLPHPPEAKVLPLSNQPN